MNIGRVVRVGQTPDVGSEFAHDGCGLIRIEQTLDAIAEMGDSREGLVAARELLEGRVASLRKQVDIHEYGSMVEVVHRGCDRRAHPLGDGNRRLPG